MEPTLGFSLTKRRDHELAIRLHLMAPAAPPWLDDRVADYEEHLVEVHLRPNRIQAAADQWTRELDALPARPWVDPR